MTKPLDGVRVIDFSWVMAGPMTTKMLGAMGAEIIKIESSQRPEFAYRDGWFAIINNNKRSCTLNIKTAEGQEIIRGLVATSDIVVENFSAGVLSKNNLAYDDLRQVKPGLIFVSASGLGRTGPERNLLAYGSLLQAYSGRVSMIGRMNPELEAMGVMPAWTDPVTSLWESLAILAALRHRDETGEGAYIDLSMLEGTVALLPDALLHAALGRNQPETGSASEIEAAPSGCFRCAGDDAWLALSVKTDEEWAGFCHAVDRYDLLESYTYRTAAGRKQAKATLNAEFAELCRNSDAAQLEAALRSHRVPASRARGIRDVVQDSHLQERGVFRQLDDGSWTITLPWTDSDGWRGDFTPTPKLGADNDYVLGEILGLPAARRAELRASGVIA